MNEARKKRIALISLLLVGVASAAAMALMGFKSGIDLTVSPTQLFDGHYPPGKRVRIGGVVKVGSIRRATGTLETTFKVTDRFKCTSVRFNRILPDLFKEGESVIATGVLAQDGNIEAQEVLAKHDENYMPPEAEAAMAAAKIRIAQQAQNGVVNGDCLP
jgi:cytochrome c-type biogenesis protein CcmE